MKERTKGFSEGKKYLANKYGKTLTDLHIKFDELQLLKKEIEEKSTKLFYECSDYKIIIGKLFGDILGDKKELLKLLEIRKRQKPTKHNSS